MVQTHASGFVLNTYTRPSPAYVTVHRSTCRTINGSPANGENWTTDYLKVCSGHVGELDEWSQREVGTEPHRCRICIR